MDTQTKYDIVDGLKTAYNTYRVDVDSYGDAYIRCKPKGGADGTAINLDVDEAIEEIARDIGEECAALAYEADTYRRTLRTLVD